MNIIAFTGAGISAQSGIPTFASNPSIRDKLTRTYATNHELDYNRFIRKWSDVVSDVNPNAAHLALKDILVITMNVDGLHERCGGEVIPIHGRLPNIVLYGDNAPNYDEAIRAILAGPVGILLDVGVSGYTDISHELIGLAQDLGYQIIIINEDAETNVPEFINNISR